MATREVPKTEWKSALAGLCEQEITRPVTVEVISKDLGSQRLVTFLPLVGLELAHHGQGPETIEITTTPEVATPEETPFTHVIAHPTHLWVQEDASGKVHAVDIESEDATKTLLRFDGGAQIVSEVD